VARCHWVIIDRVMIVLKQCSRKVDLAQQERVNNTGCVSVSIVVTSIVGALERADRGGQNGAWHIGIG
jgi:hypothetical protein